MALSDWRSEPAVADQNYIGDEMVPEISEFSYGFSLTNELVGWTELSAAPVFPSLIEEGKAGGGYDVKLDRPGAPLYLQFKRSERMERRSAREFKKITSQGGSLAIPFYRFPITAAAKSDQHELLLALDISPNSVFYAAPRFHRISEINDAWKVSEVTSRSVFISPSEIGPLDDQQHSVAFDGSGTWVCSEPRAIRGLSSRDLLEKIRWSLKQDDRPLRARLPEFVEDLRSAELRARHRIRERQQEADRQEAARRQTRKIDIGYGGREVSFERALIPTITASEELRRPPTAELPEPTPPDIRRPKAISEELRMLREASDVAARVFDTQLVIVQSAEN